MYSANAEVRRLESEINPDTRNILLEGASWNMINIRKTARAQNLPSEASFRFVRGVHPAMAERGVRRGLDLMREQKRNVDCEYYIPNMLYWFTDRVEVHSPGGPYGRVTKENFGQPGFYDYRNPNVAAVMKELGYVQRFGFGIATARREMAENGNPPP